MKRITLFVALFIVLTTAILTSGISSAEEGQRYAVTITNITRGQVITPPVVISHNEEFKLFALGSPAIPQLAALAEDGVTASLLAYAAALPTVLDTAVSAGPLMPGTSVTLEITTRGRFRYISAASMLASTNDAFFAIRNVKVDKEGELVAEAEAYDAGSEANTESCAEIPGPPCGSGGVRHPDGAEGYVHIHAGIHGIGDLSPAMMDWRNPVAEVSIRPVR
jgi:hypothetical protein